MIVTVWIVVAPDGEVSATARRIPPERVQALLAQGCIVRESQVEFPTYPRGDEHRLPERHHRLCTNPACLGGEPGNRPCGIVPTPQKWPPPDSEVLGHDVRSLRPQKSPP